MGESEADFVEIRGVRVPANFTVRCKWVVRSLSIGGMIGTAANIDKLRKLGITHILDLQAEFDDSSLGANIGIEVLWLPIAETPGPIPFEIIDQAVTFATNVLRDPANKLFVHCLAGRHRAPTVAYAILRSTGHNHDEAVERIRMAEPRAQLEEQHLQAIEQLPLARSKLNACAEG